MQICKKDRGRNQSSGSLTKLGIKRKKSPKKLFNVLFRAVAAVYKLLGG
jgi:hypothetical protein